MPITQDPKEYYQHYCLSQQRVERWVQETERQLQQAVHPAQSHGASSKEQIKHGNEQPVPPSQVVGDARQRTSHHSSSSKPHRTHDVSRSRSRPSSGFKKISSSGKRRRVETPVSLSTYLPYGILPLLFAVAGRPVITVTFAVLLLVGYIVLGVDETESSGSLSKPKKHP